MKCLDSSRTGQNVVEQQQTIAPLKDALMHHMIMMNPRPLPPPAHLSEEADWYAVAGTCPLSAQIRDRTEYCVITQKRRCFRMYGINL